MANPVFSISIAENSLATWDSQDAVGAGLTHAEIDAYTQALIFAHYFDDLSEYGVTVATDGSSFGGSAAMGGCVPLLPTDTTDSAIALLKNNDAIGCLINNSGLAIDSTNTVLNIFLPPSVSPGTFCAQATGEHDQTRKGNGDIWDWTGTLVKWTIIPTNPSCNPQGILPDGGKGTAFSPGGLLGTLSHEMAEAVTNPNSNTSRDFSGGWVSSATFGNPPLNQEIGDMCQKLVAGSNLQQPFIDDQVDDYWSNNTAANGTGLGPGKGCIAGVGANKPSTPTVTAGGASKTMTITLQDPAGSFGPPPWDLAAGQGTIYLRAQVFSPNGTPSDLVCGALSGSLIPRCRRPGSFNSGQSSGPPTTITISGFGAGYGDPTTGATNVVALRRYDSRLHRHLAELRTIGCRHGQHSHCPRQRTFTLGLQHRRRRRVSQNRSRRQ